MIAIKTNKEVMFNGGKGIVQIKIFFYIHEDDGSYTLRLDDECYTEEEVNNKIVRTKVGTTITRFKPLTKEEVVQLMEHTSVDFNKPTIVDDVEEAFRQGLLLYTQNECIQGINGEAGKGMYYSSAQDWEIVR